MLKCNKCQYEWLPRQEPEKVKECPKCKSYFWKEPKKGGQHDKRDSINTDGK